MTLRKLQYNYFKPQNYYLRLVTFFVLVASTSTITFILLAGKNLSPELILLKFISILFLLLLVSVFLEYFLRGEYMGPLEIYDIENFTNEFLKKMYEGEQVSKYFLDFDQKSKKRIKSLLGKNRHYFISSISKREKTYQITLVHSSKFFVYLFFRFSPLGKSALRRMVVRSVKGKLKIIYLH
ncbi:hypothetical protein H6501_01295 [Candidatus Woesearchaeota archaeon]|nr:hypothetical protein [Nanoarchaeota archaeon]MCB9370211.1 hypothetical protein [Candidatus Woesearchaeota archaeon]USN44739.1 MAG: hypothetical protein H6500_02760 [Candidatus Woesearchaeota archaeon]